MDLIKYKGFFHDGSIFSIKENLDTIEILMESSEIRPEWNSDHLLLSATNTLRGKLILSEVTNICIDGIKTKSFSRESCDFEILRFNIEANNVNFFVNSFDYTARIDTFHEFNFQSRQIKWENDPALCFD